METLHTILLVLQVLVAVSLIGLILIQHGKGAEAGAAFGSGASNTVFGAQGSGNFLSRTTAILAFVFLTNSLGLAYIASKRVQTTGSLMDSPVTEVQSADAPVSDAINEIPAEPAPAPASDVPVEPVATAPTDVPAPAEVVIPAEPAAAEPAAAPSVETPVDAVPASAEPVMPAVQIDVPAPPAVQATE
jgi:preprotein translocase subunit SecG